MLSPPHLASASNWNTLLSQSQPAELHIEALSAQPPGSGPGGTFCLANALLLWLQDFDLCDFRNFLFKLILNFFLDNHRTKAHTSSEVD